ncbi:MAG TPA: Gfo/Idh/MocA family oxidoreductase [Cyclobacteriaceae bacterium]|nr:Gfo/Idh/MocA family oxidoreductase [Cyclobacteriaceae bacterium]
MKTGRDSSGKIQRRDFIRKAGLTVTAFSIVPRFVLGGRGYVPPSDTLYIAGIGVGGKGESDLTECAKSPNARVAFLCDVDDRQAIGSKKNFPEAKYYKDYRVLLEKEGNNIDACTISTPDHSHANIAMAAMRMGKHVYVQKPLTHDIYEARMLAEAAVKYKVVTQMGNQYASDEPVRRMQEIVNAGLIGDVTRVWAWTDRPVWPQGVPAPSGKHDVPAGLDWDLWLGSESLIEYNPAYVPFNWRGWWKFGTGALGDMGCHIMDPVFRILPIDFPTEVECSTTTNWVGFFEVAHYDESCPASSIIHLRFPRKDGKGDIKLTWMDGGLLPERPQELKPDEPFLDNGVIFEGTKGKLLGNYSDAPRLLPTTRMEELKSLQKILPRVPEGHYVQWVNGCLKGYDNAVLSSPFSFAGPFTEAVLMGNLAIRSYQYFNKTANQYPGRKKLLWDARNMKITNFDPANAFVKREYRKGWELSM